MPAYEWGLPDTNNRNILNVKRACDADISNVDVPAIGLLRYGKLFLAFFELVLQT